MLKMFRYVKDRWLSIVLIVLLLFLQAYCDLSMPDYTSRIVNVGIQQKGVEDGVPDEIRQSTMEDLFLFMTETEIAEVQANYTLAGDTYVLREADKETRTRLNKLFGIPMLVLSGITEEGTRRVQFLEQLNLPADIDVMAVLKETPKEQVLAMLDGITAQLSDMPESIMTQSASAFVQREYETMGRDVAAIQTGYILKSGLKMLGLAAR